jgi:hypothetical protein
LGECDLKFGFGHLLSLMAAAANHFKERRVAERCSPAFGRTLSYSPSLPMASTSLQSASSSSSVRVGGTWEFPAAALYAFCNWTCGEIGSCHFSFLIQHKVSQCLTTLV